MIILESGLWHIIQQNLSCTLLLHTISHFIPSFGVAPRLFLSNTPFFRMTQSLQMKRPGSYDEHSLLRLLNMVKVAKAVGDHCSGMWSVSSFVTTLVHPLRKGTICIVPGILGALVGFPFFYRLKLWNWRR